MTRSSAKKCTRRRLDEFLDIVVVFRAVMLDKARSPRRRDALSISKSTTLFMVPILLTVLIGPVDCWQWPVSLRSLREAVESIALPSPELLPNSINTGPDLSLPPDIGPGIKDNFIDTREKFSNVGNSVEDVLNKASTMGLDPNAGGGGPADNPENPPPSTDSKSEVDQQANQDQSGNGIQQTDQNQDVPPNANPDLADIQQANQNQTGDGIQQESQNQDLSNVTTSAPNSEDQPNIVVLQVVNQNQTGNGIQQVDQNQDLPQVTTSQANSSETNSNLTEVSSQPPSASEGTQPDIVLVQVVNQVQTGNGTQQVEQNDDLPEVTTAPSNSTQASGNLTEVSSQKPSAANGEKDIDAVQEGNPNQPGNGTGQTGQNQDLPPIASNSSTGPSNKPDLSEVTTTKSSGSDGSNLDEVPKKDPNERPLESKELDEVSTQRVDTESPATQEQTDNTHEEQTQDQEQTVKPKPDKPEADETPEPFGPGPVDPPSDDPNKIPELEFPDFGVFIDGTASDSGSDDFRGDVIGDVGSGGSGGGSGSGSGSGSGEIPEEIDEQDGIVVDLPDFSDFIGGEPGPVDPESEEIDPEIIPDPTTTTTSKPDDPVVTFVPEEEEEERDEEFDEIEVEVLTTEHQIFIAGITRPVTVSESPDTTLEDTTEYEYQQEEYEEQYDEDYEQYDEQDEDEQEYYEDEYEEPVKPSKGKGGKGSSNLNCLNQAKIMYSMTSLDSMLDNLEAELEQRRTAGLFYHNSDIQKLMRLAVGKYVDIVSDIRWLEL